MVESAERKKVHQVPAMRCTQKPWCCGTACCDRGQIQCDHDRVYKPYIEQVRVNELLLAQAALPHLQEVCLAWRKAVKGRSPAQLVVDMVGEQTFSPQLLERSWMRAGAAQVNSFKRKEDLRLNHYFGTIIRDLPVGTEWGYGLSRAFWMKPCYVCSFVSSFASDLW